MKFSVGYSIKKDDRLVDDIIELKDGVNEVYFSWGTTPSGRNDQTRNQSLTPWEAQTKQVEDLSRLADAGLKFNLLFNANCYGELSQSRDLFCKVGEIVEFVKNSFGLQSVTTTSPLIAKFIKQNFSDIDVRASVNMSIGSVLGMEYLKDVYDSFYVKRELNRDFGALKTLRKWCDDNGKEMYLLANSGCLNDCSAHTFHDNLVAHESEIAKMDNGYQFEGACKKFLKREGNIGALLTATNFIRPEDVSLYEELVKGMKLATRVHESPSRIMRAYIERGKFVGNTASLLEPNHAPTIYPYVLNNNKIKSQIQNDKLIYSDGGNAFEKLEENYAYQQND
ncbi:MAG: hypothetical protein II988_05640 [Clostridia bacterium]|nr:hypothetical protein [Clostridia bacterium]